MQPHATIAERIALGRPFDAASDAAPDHAPRPVTALIGRLLLAGIFLISGIFKLVDPTGTAAYMTSAGIPYADVLVYVAAFAEVAGAASIMLGFLTRIGALGLIVFLVLVNLMIHTFWTFEGAQRTTQMSSFLKNLALMGGLALLVANGPGRYSLDARMRRPDAAPRPRRA